MPKINNKGRLNKKKAIQNKTTSFLPNLISSSSKLTETSSVYFPVTDKKDNVRTSSLFQELPIVKLSEEFYNKDCLQLAKELLGQLVVHECDGVRLSGFVVETECYLGNYDAASHSFKGKRTPRNEPMYMEPGTSYLYSIYGIYYCFNISSKEVGSCVLIRALQPFEGMELMNELRESRRATKKTLKEKDLCNGPSKLCQALNLTKESCNKLEMATSDTFWIEKGNSVYPDAIVTTKRVGIESAGPESANKPLRFYILGNPHVSVRDREAEQLLAAK